MFRIIAASAATTAAVALWAAPAQADAPLIETGVTAVCNAATGNWDLTWTLTNNLNSPALTITQISTPAPGVGTLPSVPGNGTAQAHQTVDGAASSAQLDYVAVWTQVWPSVSRYSSTTWTAPTANGDVTICTKTA
ncbi:hypothetical protein ACWT_3187 [Actinoplanes sp. SE50]|uniref:hypothetical protein n=1 Tax=unclassified Actinoplanes TaxID=2626549 RepID=UPI00023EC7AC|nr:MULTISPECIES: hypothetical protein [unclassified Actinoplanes]AEV84210.1 hypothetical protein ACPL_3315 [Actinoplanes sp. SE50/110]ATO82602.1 hypothetical protein ACWT_3187 [Actinoplanes sp. SE50]SLM00009.1 hypothetical protein ACSP50_3241 [Actinoplanes sp. SE50/110]